MIYHRVPQQAVDLARATVASILADGADVGDVPETAWRVAAGVATRDDLMNLVTATTPELVTAAISASQSVAIAELLNEAAELEAAMITQVAAMIDLGWERALQQAESRAKTKLAKSQRRDELPFDGWPNPAVVAYLGADSLVHGQFEVLSREVGEALSSLHQRFVDIAQEISQMTGVVTEPPPDRSDEIAAVLLALLKTRAMAFMAGQARQLDPAIVARNIVSFLAYRTLDLPDLLDAGILDVSAFTTSSWVESLGSMMGQVQWSVVWRHAFYRIPETPFPPHVAMNGRTLTLDQLLEAGVWPGDHPFCTCALIRRWWAA